MKKNSFQLGFFTPRPEITLDRLQRKLKSHIPLVLIFSPWKVSWKKKTSPFPSKLCGLIAKNKSIPFIKWEPATWTKVPNRMINDFPLDKIIDGGFDDYLTEWAKAAKKFKKEIWLSFGHEMNGRWYYWAGDPSNYKKALLRAYGIFKKTRANNVRWVFCVNNYPLDYAEYFPKELIKDKKIIIAIDGYNAEGVWGLRWKPFRDIFRAPYIYVRSRFPGKKIIIGEFACAKKGGNKKEWIRDCFISIKKEFPLITSAVWFNINKEADWRIFSV